MADDARPTGNHGLVIQQDAFGDQPKSETDRVFDGMMNRLEAKAGRFLAREGLLGEMITLIAEQAVEIEKLKRACLTMPSGLGGH